MKRFSVFDGRLWHREDGCGAVSAGDKVTATAGAELCPGCLAMPDRSIPAHIHGYTGLGDNFYMKPAVRAYIRSREGGVYLETAWPQVWRDVDVLLVKSKTGLRTQKRNVSRCAESVWRKPDPRAVRHQFFYGREHLMAGGTVPQVFEGQLEVTATADDFRTRADPSWLERFGGLSPGKPFGVVHPPSIRAEWKNTARPPRPEYLQTLIDAAPHLNWVSIGFLEDGREWLCGKPLRGIHRSFDHGELGAEDMMGIISLARVALSGPCYMLPMAASLGTPTFTVFGGSVPPENLIDPRMGQHVGHVAPDPFCECLTSEHDCRKEIESERLLGAWRRFMTEQSV